MAQAGQITDHISGGFANPVFDAQAIFRAVMDAMARPGTVQTATIQTAPIQTAPIQPAKAATRPPQPLSPGAAAVALTLCDNDTPLWLDARLKQAPAVASWLGFHAGAPLAEVPADAHFALVADPAELMALENFAQGSQEYPDRSTTLILQVDTLSGGQALILEGPGIDGTTRFAPSPLPRHFVEQWKQNRARFPRGVDLVLVAPEGIACLPRSTRIRTVES
jgi:alpha-D-ribose 1-methylphosphonate 5-triphosphate synthase subunit PhnH